MALATAMYYSGKNPLKKVTYKSESVESCKDIEQRRIQKAFLRYHDPKNWPMLRVALKQMGREDMIGTGPQHLVPPDRPGRGPTRPPVKPLKQRPGMKAAARSQGARQPPVK
jgi:hypothetical protein